MKLGNGLAAQPDKESFLERLLTGFSKVTEHKVDNELGKTVCLRWPRVIRIIEKRFFWDFFWLGALESDELFRFHGGTCEN